MLISGWTTVTDLQTPAPLEPRVAGSVMNADGGNAGIAAVRCPYALEQLFR